MAKTDPELLDAYNSLAVADQTVLQAMAVLLEPASAGVVSSCLNSANCRESPLRAFTVQIVAVRLARLAKANFAKPLPGKAKDQKSWLWRVRPDVGELAIRHAVRDGRFKALAKAALEVTRGKDWLNEGAGENPARGLHIAFHAGDWRGAVREARELDLREPGKAGVFVNGILDLQTDDSWLPRERPADASPFFEMVLYDLLSELEDPGSTLATAEKLLEAGAAGLAAPVGETLLMRGRIRPAERLAVSAADGTARERILQLLDFIKGDDASSLEHAGVVLAAQRRLNASRDQLLAGDAGVWQALSMLRIGTPEQLDRLDKALDAQAAKNDPRAAELSFVRNAVQFRLGQTFAAKSIPRVPFADGDSGVAPLTTLIHGLASLWIEPSRLPVLLPGIEAAHKKAKASGYRWFASQLAGLAAKAGAKGGAAAGETWPLLAEAFADRDEWRRGLSALDDLAAAPESETKLFGKRIGWLVADDAGDPENPYCRFTVRPVEQVFGKSGGWSKGRNISLRRLYQDSPSFYYATEQDRLVFSTLRYTHDREIGEFVFDSSQALAFLVGHPHVYRDDASGAKIEVAEGRFELSAVERDGGCVISLEPPLSEFLPADAQDRIDGMDSAWDTAARYETPTRLRVLRLGEHERRLARIVGDGLTVPAAGREEALRVLAGLAERFRIQSDLPELASEGEAEPTDSRPRLHLIPLNPGMEVEIWVHPLGDEGPAYRPGRGGKILSGDLNGKTVRTVRDLDEEKRLARAVAAACPALEGYESGPLAWRLDNPEAALSFMADAGELGERAVLAWPKGGRFRVRRLGNPSNLGISVSRNSDWLELDGAITVDEGLTISMEKLLAAVRNSDNRFVSIGDNEFLAITDELRRQLADIESFAEIHGGKVRLPLLAGGMLGELEELGASVKADAEWLRFLEKQKQLADYTAPIPADFRAELRDYQVEGFRWLARLAEWGAGGCLADDMGLGKTIQALALLVHRAKLGPAIVVAPTSVCHNWLAETGRFAPTLRSIPFGEGDREKTLANLGPGDLVIASYGLLQQEEKLFAGVKWATAALDEAQAIKNVATKRSKAAMSLKAGFRFITTGTPIENHLGELWNLFRFINPHLLGSWRRFQERFAAPVERLDDEAARERLRRVIRPFILRRSKSQVLSSLPPKTEITLEVEMGREERAFYEALRRQALERLSESDGGLEEKRFQILAEIMKLRRACCSPELITGDLEIPSAKQEQFRQTLEELLENRHKALVFSQFVAHLSIIRRHLDAEGVRYQYLDGSTPAKKRKQAVEAFQNGDGDVFLISLKAGGLGLNLTAADYVIHMDPWWNPAVEDQASDRAHRIGQTRPVTVYRLVAAGTIEDRIVALHRRKRDLADTLLADSDQSAAIDIEEIMALLREE